MNEIDSHSLDPDPDPPDPDPEVLDLETKVERLGVMLKYWSRHLTSCPRGYGQWPTPCTCGLNAALAGTLWVGAGDSADLATALTSVAIDIDER